MFNSSKPSDAMMMALAFFTSTQNDGVGGALFSCRILGNEKLKVLSNGARGGPKPVSIDPF
jgi:hypothetical protein